MVKGKTVIGEIVETFKKTCPDMPPKIDASLTKKINTAINKGHKIGMIQTKRERMVREGDDRYTQITRKTTIYIDVPSLYVGA